MMKRNIFILCALITTIMFFTASCSDTSSDDTQTDAPDTSVHDDTENNTDDVTTADDTQADAPDTSVYNDTEDSNDDSTVADDAEELILPTKEEWDSFEFGRFTSDHSYKTICALLAGDIDEFARLCGVEPEVYDNMRTMKIGSYRLYSEDIDLYPYGPTRYPILEIEVTESESEFFSVGTHRLVFEEGLYMMFHKREDFRNSSYEISPAYVYASNVGSDKDFYPILAEGRSQFGLGDFIVNRLDIIEGSSKPRTEEEIRAYAEKYLGVDGDTLQLDRFLEKVDGGYICFGRSGAAHVETRLGEEIRDDVTVVTIKYWADYSKTVSSRTVEFHLGMLDGEYYPIKTVILADSELKTVYYSA